jgi:alkanesulfonate monooxygenase SsuD/methylene tetrahydromethanopterin reductase-like flavin-dependent oxidoreductase (luciferase family)
MRFGLSLPNVGEPGKDLVLADPWVVLGAIAARTSRIKLGTSVTPIPRRRPWKLAKEITTLDHLPGGWVIVGMGLGAPPEEFTDFGEDAGGRVRAAKLDEGLGLLDAFLRGDRVDHDGEQFTVLARLTPATVQRPRPPIRVAAVLPSRGPIEHARRWDGVFPLEPDAGGGLTLTTVAQPAAELGPAHDIVTALPPSKDPDEYAAAGATWGIEGPEWPERDDPRPGAEERIRQGPPRLRTTEGR